MAINAKNAIRKSCPQEETPWNQEKNPKCPDGHGEMVPTGRGEERRVYVRLGKRRIQGYYRDDAVRRRYLY